MPWDARMGLCMAAGLLYYCLCPLQSSHRAIERERALAPRRRRTDGRGRERGAASCPPGAQLHGWRAAVLGGAAECTVAAAWRRDMPRVERGESGVERRFEG
eukprot:scaffold12763_cov115-Isochrysis_galbana.AAC.5